MTEDQDNAGEVVAGAVRVALTAAGQLAEQAARRREADLREAERASAARMATLQSQLAAERELAVRSVRDVVQRGDAATVDEVVRAWEQARNWDAPTMTTEQAQLRDRIRVRFGVDVSSLAANPSAGKQVTATAVVAGDVHMQTQDDHHRRMAQGRPASLQDERVDDRGDNEAVVAQVLAAESFPLPAVRATRGLLQAPSEMPLQVRRRRSVELQAPQR